MRDALDAAPEANLVLAVSALVFEDVICQRHTSLSADDFTKVEIADEAKGFAAPAWVRVPGVRAAASAGRDAGSERRDEVLAISLRFLVDPRDFPGVVDQVLAPSFAAAGIALSDEVLFDADDPMVRLPGSSLQQVLGVWIHHLDRLLEAHGRGMRMVVGISTASDDASASGHARELASSGPAARVLSTARGGRVAVVVPTHVHQAISRNPGRLVVPETYGPVDASSWLRVPGHAKPPQPVDRVREEPGVATAQGVGSVNAYGEHGIAIGSGPFDTFVVGTLNRYGGTDR